MRKRSCLEPRPARPRALRSRPLTLCLAQRDPTGSSPGKGALPWRKCGPRREVLRMRPPPAPAGCGDGGGRGVRLRGCGAAGPRDADGAGQGADRRGERARAAAENDGQVFPEVHWEAWQLPG